MCYSLKRHPDSLCDAVTHIDVDVTRPRASSLLLSYTVAGRVGDLLVAAPVAPSRSDELWRHTCFEAFLRTGPDGAYYEFNFAPSTRWAVYRFDGYRSGMRVAEEIAAPEIEVASTPERYTLRAALELGEPLCASRWQLGFSAVIEEANGRKSYWALAHPLGKPDFHHSDCFAAELSTA
jgi:hypothetical protein